jgi:hypothetical protein
MQLREHLAEEIMTTSTTDQLAYQCPTTRCRTSVAAPATTAAAVGGTSEFGHHGVHQPRPESPPPHSDRRRVTAWFAALRGLYADIRRAWREGAALPHELPLRDYPIARR